MIVSQNRQKLQEFISPSFKRLYFHKSKQNLNFLVLFTDKNRVQGETEENTFTTEKIANIKERKKN